MKSTRSYKKIKINDKNVEIHYIEHIYADDERVMNIQNSPKSEVKPHIDFVKKFQALKTHMVSIGELSLFKNGVTQKELEKYVVTTLNVFESDDDTKIQVSLNKFVKSGHCYSVTPPLISLEHEDYENLEELAILVDDIIFEAGDYLNGVKHGEQPNLFSDVRAA